MSNMNEVFICIESQTSHLAGLLTICTYTGTAKTKSDI